MNLPRLLAIALICIECGAFAVVGEHTVFGIFAAVLAVMAGLLPYRMHLRRNQAIGALFALALFAAIPHFAGMYPPRFILIPSLAPLLFVFDFFVLAQVGLLLQAPAPASPLARPVEFLFLAMTGLIGAGAGEGNSGEQSRYGYFCLAASLIAILYIAALQQKSLRQAPLRWFHLALLLLASGLALLFNSAVSQYGNQIDQLIADRLTGLAPTNSLGFTRSATLNSISRMRGMPEEVALRVYAKEAPGYLRACAFDTYENGRWSNSTQPQPVQTEQTDQPRKIFQLAKTEQTPQPEMEIWQEENVQDTIFLPEHAATVAAAAESMTVDGHGAAQARGLDIRLPLQVSTTPDAALPAPQDIALLLRVPDTLDPKVRELARRLVPASSAAQEAALRVADYFHANYKYEVGIQVPSGVEPLNYFLLERPAAHCEYFAAGAVTLLRLSGIPARYITGFVAVEEDPFDGAWIARSRDAHAWAEAYDPKLGWFLVEATPAAGIPMQEQRSKWSYAPSYLKQQWRNLRAWLTELQLAVLLENLAKHPMTIGTIAAAAAVGLMLTIRNLPRARKKRQKPAPELLVMHRDLRRQDRLMRRHGLTRRPNETLHQFAARIQHEKPELTQQGTWYLDYALRRYRG